LNQSQEHHNDEEKGIDYLNKYSNSFIASNYLIDEVILKKVAHEAWSKEVVKKY
jgi:hypothetical protein